MEDNDGPCFGCMLECVFSAGRLGPGVRSLPEGRRCLSANAVLKVGRAVQHAEFWETLLPEALLRGAISREHVEIGVLQAGKATLKNLSAVGTLVNGELIRGCCYIRVGDIIGFPTRGLRPLLEFRLGVGDCIPTAEDVTLQDVTLPVPITPHGQMAPVVKISICALPSPLTLECTASCRLSAAELKCLPYSSRVLETCCSLAQLRVGLAEQPAAFWSRLLPGVLDLREALSEEEFVVSLEPSGFSVRGRKESVLVDGRRLREPAPILSGAIFSIGMAPGGTEPALSFRLGAASGFEAAAAESRVSERPNEASEASETASAGSPRSPSTDSTASSEGAVEARPSCKLSSHFDGKNSPIGRRPSCKSLAMPTSPMPKPQLFRLGGGNLIPTAEDVTLTGGTLTMPTSPMAKPRLDETPPPPSACPVRTGPLRKLAL